MGCPYQFYKEGDNTYYPRLYCSIDDTTCFYAKRCDRVYKFISMDNAKECYKYNLEMTKNIPNGSYYVQTYRPNKKGKLYLYILIGEKIEKILTDFTEINQNYVYLKDGIDGYEVSLTPFKEERKATRKQRKVVDDIDD